MAWSLNEVPLFDLKISRVDQLDHIFAYKTLTEWPKKIYEKVSLGGGRVLPNYVRLRWAILRLLIFHPWKNIRTNIQPCKIFSPDKFTSLTNIHSWNILTPKKYLTDHLDPPIWLTNSTWHIIVNHQPKWLTWQVKPVPPVPIEKLYQLYQPESLTWQY